MKDRHHLSILGWVAKRQWLWIIMIIILVVGLIIALIDIALGKTAQVRMHLQSIVV